MIKNILVPVDGSEGADRAIEKAVMLAQICEIELSLCCKHQPTCD